MADQHPVLVSIWPVEGHWLAELPTDERIVAPTEDAVKQKVLDHLGPGHDVTFRRLLPPTL